MAHTLHDLTDDGPTDTPAQCLMNLPNTHSRCAGQGFHMGHNVGGRGRASEPLATDLRRGPATGRGAALDINSFTPVRMLADCVGTTEVLQY